MLKNLLASLILLFSLTTFSQTQINIEFEFDGYADEISWDILDNNGDTLASGGDYANGQPTALEIIDSVPLGSYTFNLHDSYGDGLSYPTNGWCLVTDTCSLIDTLAYVMGDFGTLYTETLTIVPCAPPIGGCLDSLATNYNPIAVFDDGSCIYPPCTGLDTLWVEEYCDGSENKVYFHWANMPNPSCRMAYYTKSDDLNDLGNNWYPYPGNFSNTGLIYSNQLPNTTYYFLGQLTDGSYTDTLSITTGECNAGCTDPTALNYNPWANIDDGSCQSPPANCSSGLTNIIITVTPDTYPDETSWEISDTNGVYGTVLFSSPSYGIVGVPVITEVCIPDGTVIEFTLIDAFGDGMCGTCYGGVDGTVLVQTLCGDTIFSLVPGSANFGTDTTSAPYTVTPCTPTIIPGCMDDTYVEYNSAATVDDSSCTTLKIYGCTDIASPDYDPTANTMQTIPDCDYTLVLTDGAGDGWFGSWLGVLQDTSALGQFTMGPNDGTQLQFTIHLDADELVELMFFAPGNSSSTANQCGFYLINPLGDTLISGGTNAWTNPILQFPYRYSGIPYCGNYCIPGVLGCMDPTALNYDSLANMPDTCVPIILGCTNVLAFNYNPAANVDDLSCIPTILGCMDSTAFNFNPTANVNDSNSCIPIILGCMDDSMFNYNAAANTDDSTCIPIIFGCTDPMSFNYDSLANTNNSSCIPILFGCTDPLAFNFDPNANTDDSTCIPVIYGCTDIMMFNYNLLANTDNGTCIPFIYGCTDSTMFNYNPMANTDNNTCEAFIYGCIDPTAMNYDPTANTNDNSCIPFIYGCTDSTMFNYNPLANTDNGSCELFIFGCNDSLALNFNPLANTSNNSCCYIAGCTDSTALNYNPNACYDDNSCITIIIGCTDVNAYNYNSAANVSDTTACLYDAGCYGGPGIPYWLNDGCYAWVIDVDDYCCTTTWDASCQSMYDYCQLGWPTGLEETGSGTTIIVYPNPTNSIINIDTRLDVNIQIYNIIGVLLFEGKNKRIDISEFPSGVYNLTINYDKLIFNKRIVKQ